MKITAWKRLLAGMTAFVLLVTTCISSGKAAVAPEPDGESVYSEADVSKDAAEDVSGEDVKSDTPEEVKADNEENPAEEGPVVEEDPEAEDPAEAPITVKIPETWCKSHEGWVTAAEGYTVYYKISDELPEDWEGFEGSQLWKTTGSLPESDAEGDYIKFWAVKDENDSFETDAYKFFLDHTSPAPFTVEKKVNNGDGTYVLVCSTLSDDLSGIESVDYVIGSDIDNAAVVLPDNKGGYSIPFTDDMKGKEIVVSVKDKAGNRASFTYKDEPYTFEAKIPEGWTTNRNKWEVKASKDVSVYYLIKDYNNFWETYHDANEWNNDVTIGDTGKNGSYIKFWAVEPNGDIIGEPKVFQFYLDSTKPEEFEIQKAGKGEGPYYLKNQNPVKDASSGIEGVYYSVDTKLETVEAVHVHNQRAEMTEKNGEISFSIPCESEWDNKIVYVYVIDKAGNMRTVSFAVAPTYFKADVPGKWTNHYDNWVIASDDVTVYCRIKIHNQNWGKHTYEQAFEWNENTVIDDANGKYIKFWAVREGEVLDETKPKQFYLDTEAPNSFVIERIGAGVEPYELKNREGITYSKAPVSAMYYSIGERFDTISELKANATSLNYTREGKEYHFLFSCTPEMEKKTVYVYVVDEAGNIRTESYDVQTYIDRNKPNLTVEGIEENKWYNQQTAQDNWSITTSENAKIYFVTAQNDLKDWGLYTDKGVKEWNPDYSKNDIEGEGYIHFWAVYTELPYADQRDVATKTVKYKYDQTRPEVFKLDCVLTPGNANRRPSLTINGTGINDSLSKVDIENIHYRITASDGSTIRDSKVPKKNISVDKDGNISFSLDISSYRITKSQIEICVSDYAGNEQPVFSNYLDFDPEIPRIVTDYGMLGVVSEDTEETELLAPYSFGGEKTKTQWKAVYVKGDEYIKITVKEVSLAEIIVKTYKDGLEDQRILFYPEDSSDEKKTWICHDTSDNEVKTYYLKVSDIMEDIEPNQMTDITLEVKDTTGSECPFPVFLLYKTNADDPGEAYKLFYDPDDESDSHIKVTPKEKTYGREVADESLSVSLSDDNGLKAYSVSVNGREIEKFNLSAGERTSSEYPTITYEIDEDGEEQQIEGKATEEYNLPYKSYAYKLALSNKKYPFVKNGAPVDGKYEIVIETEDLAGNKRTLTHTIKIDTTCPELTGCEYQFEENAMNSLSFGIFGREAYVLRVEVTDPALGREADGSGVKSVVLNWADLSITGTRVNKSDVYEFTALPLDSVGELSITVTDTMGNSATYNLISAFDEDAGDKKAFAQFDPVAQGLKLMLENTAPVSGIVLPEELTVPEDETDELVIYKQKTEDGTAEWWYPVGMKYEVYAQDEASGLYAVKVIVNDSVAADEKQSGSVKFDSGILTDKVTFRYELTEEGCYRIFAYAIDNALNSDEKKPLSEQNAVVHLDLTKPQITEMQFGEESDLGDAVEKTTYGFFFTEETEARVYVEDTGESSGFRCVSLFLSNVNGTNETFTVDAADLLTEEETERQYASFTIKKGFKGKVTASVTDNVGHSSGIINADGNIVEDQEIHSQTSSIVIKENEAAKRKDAKGAPLYKASIPVTVTVEDSFSGIETIEWSIANDGEKGTIAVDLEGNYKNVTGKAQILEDSVVKDQNLVTKLQFRIVVNSNTNGNVVHVKMTDRAGNTSEQEAVYSIDTTVPEITASFGNGKAKNGKYYNAGQTVTVTVKERNFSPQEVVLKVNGATQAIRWNESGSSVSTDETAHVGTFSVTADGEYVFTIAYTDMAGNAGTTFSQSQFIIDTTAPKITNNFASFGDLKDENIYFNSKQKDSANAVITVNEKNFFPEDMHVTVYRMPAGSKHSEDGAEWEEYNFGNYWSESGTEHTLTIPFTMDGVYKVVMAPVDHAGNAGDFAKADGQYQKTTAIFEIDYTAPVVAMRNGKYVKSDDYEFLDLYNYDRRNDDAPAVAFSDINISYIDFQGQRYTPVYENGREIGVIAPEEFKGRQNNVVKDASTPTMEFVLDGFEKDGVYSVQLLAYDKAGNVSVLNDNTFVRMVDPAVKVLAYIENSSRENSTGWYSFEDENGPISKRPGSFSDLSIVVFSRRSEKTRICLVDKATDEVTDTRVTDNESSLFDDSMYDVGAYRYVLPGQYFVENFTADADTSIYLRIENSGEALDLGEMNIDNTVPNCKIPDHFHNWGWVRGNGEQTVVFSDISEVLEIDKTVAYVDGETIPLSVNPYDAFYYNEMDRTVSLTLAPGSHKVGLLLVDRAGNTKSISEVHHLAIGNYRVWIGIGSGFGAILLAAVAVWLTKRSKRNKQGQA